MTATRVEHHAFGKNWMDFVCKSADDERVEIAKKHLLAFLGRDDLRGLDFLDIGCGSGIHSLAAYRAGARKIHGFDCDIDSVGATEIMRHRASSPGNWSVERGDILDDRYVDGLGRWTLVYSWGVLHHTGDVWRAVDNAARTVADGGLLYICARAGQNRQRE